jgi:hypothetical protein
MNRLSCFAFSLALAFPAVCYGLTVAPLGAEICASSYIIQGTVLSADLSPIEDCHNRPGYYCHCKGQISVDVTQVVGAKKTLGSRDQIVAAIKNKTLSLNFSEAIFPSAPVAFDSCHTSESSPSGKSYYFSISSDAEKKGEVSNSEKLIWHAKVEPWITKFLSDIVSNSDGISCSTSLDHFK